MTDKRTQEQANDGNMQKDPDDWVTGDEPMTGAQRSYLKTLSEEAKVPFDENLTKAEASKRIDELQEITGRGKDEPPAGLRYLPGFLSRKEHDRLVAEVERLEFHEVVMKGVTAKRTTAHFGYDYAYDSFRVAPAAPIPGFLSDVRARPGRRRRSTRSRSSRRSSRAIPRAPRSAGTATRPLSATRWSGSRSSPPA